MAAESGEGMAKSSSAVNGSWWWISGGNDVYDVVDASPQAVSHPNASGIPERSTGCNGRSGVVSGAGDPASEYLSASRIALPYGGRFWRGDNHQDASGEIILEMDASHLTELAICRPAFCLSRYNTADPPMVSAVTMRASGCMNWREKALPSNESKRNRD